jgi:LSD1 subclass zinc finger protein
MEIRNMACESCGAPLKLTPGQPQVHCGYCGAAYEVDRRTGLLATEMGERLDRLETALAESRARTAASTDVSSDAAASSQRDWRLALALCLFFGTFGLHRFYTGYPIAGALQIVSVGGFGLWWLVDLARLLLGTFRDADGRGLGHYDPATGRSLLVGMVALLGVAALLGAADTAPRLVLPFALVAGIMASVLVAIRERRSRAGRRSSPGPNPAGNAQKGANDPGD